MEMFKRIKQVNVIDLYLAVYLLQSDESALVSVEHNVELERGKAGSIWVFDETEKIAKALEAKNKSLSVDQITIALGKLGMEVVPKGGKEEKPKRSARAKAGLSPEDRAKRDGVLKTLVGKPVEKKAVSDALRKVGLTPKGWAGTFVKLGGKLKD